MKIIVLTLTLLVPIFSFGSVKAPAVKQQITGGNPNATQGGTLTYEFYEPDNINPINYRQVGAIEILTQWIFESLTDYDVVTGEIIPNLAKRWEISKDGKVFTFWIDERAKWFDGKPVTAEDVEFSFDVYSMPGANAAFKKANIAQFQEIKVLDERTVQFVAKERLFSHFGFLSGNIILPKHLYYHTDPEKLARNEYTLRPQGSGPYIVKDLIKGDKAVLVKNQNYWGRVLPQNVGAYNFDEIIIKYIRDPQIAFEKLKKGDIDYMPIRIGNTELWRQTKTDKAFTSGKIRALAVQSKIQQGYGFIGFNLQNDLFKDVNVRLALEMGVNREQMIRRGLDGLARVPKGPLYSVDNFEGTFVETKYDPAGALKILEQAGWKDHDGDYILDKDGRQFSFTVLVPNARIEKEMLFVQDYWKDIGVDAKVKILEYSTWRQLQDERKFDAVSNGKARTFYPWSVDAFSEWHSSNNKKGLSNYYGYANSEVDKLIEQARGVFDFRERKKLLDRVNDLIASEHVFLQYSESKYSLHAVNKSVSMPEHEGSLWFPYLFGIKYWYKEKR